MRVFESLRDGAAVAGQQVLLLVVLLLVVAAAGVLAIRTARRQVVGRGGGLALGIAGTLSLAGALGVLYAVS